MPDLTGQLVFWSATARNPNYAWYYFGESGEVASYYRTESYPARCVGR